MSRAAPTGHSDYLVAGFNAAGLNEKVQYNLKEIFCEEVGSALELLAGSCSASLNLV